MSEKPKTFDEWLEMKDGNGELDGYDEHDLMCESYLAGQQSMNHFADILREIVDAADIANRTGLEVGRSPLVLDTIDRARELLKGKS